MQVLRVIEEAGQRLALRREGERYDVVLGNVVLLSSAALETEEAFGRLTPEGSKRVLVGGLGFGATARGALERLAPGGEVIVVEKLAAIETLLRGELAHLAGGVLDDPRVRVVRADVAQVIEQERALDAILLDVDNGPEWASFRANARLYAPAGLASARRALSAGGVYAVWSGYAADAFLPKLRAAGMVASIVPLEERGVMRARAYVGRALAR